MLAAGAVATGLVLSLALGPAVPDPAIARLAAPASPQAPRTLSRDFFGMHAITIPPSGIPGVASVRLWDTDTTWRVLNPRRGVYRWRTLDQRVAAARSAGASVLLVLGATPAWAARSLGANDAPWLGPGSASVPRRLSDWTAFVTAVAQRYAGRIEAYQVWNEPADPIFWRGSDATLARMTRLAHDVISAADPQAVVVAAPLIVRGARWQARATGYLQALGEEGWPVDVLAFHGYASGAPGPAAHSTAVAGMRALVDSSGAPALPLWETEVNYPDSAAVRQPIGTLAERAWLARTYLDAARLGVDRVYWYAYAKVPSTLAVDIRNPAVTPAFAAVAGWLGGSRFAGCTETWQGNAGVTGCSFLDSSGRSAVALWATGAMAVQPGRGEAADLAGATWSVGDRLEIGATPVWFRPSGQPN